MDLEYFETSQKIPGARPKAADTNGLRPEAASVTEERRTEQEGEGSTGMGVRGRGEREAANGKKAGEGEKRGAGETAKREVRRRRRRQETKEIKQQGHKYSKCEKQTKQMTATTCNGQ